MHADTLTRRHGQRGAAMLESVLVAGVLTAFLGAGAFLQRLYTNALATSHDARQRAWTAALTGCGKKTRAAAFVTGLIDEPQTPDPMRFVVRRLPEKSFASARGELLVPARLSGGRASHDTTVSVACNEISARGERADHGASSSRVFGRILPRVR